MSLNIVILWILGIYEIHNITKCNQHRIAQKIDKPNKSMRI